MPGIAYIYEYDIEDIDSFEAGLKTLYPIEKIIRANWLKSRNKYVKSFLITFSSTNLADTLRIPGEIPTKVYKYYNQPMLCTRCQGYGHTYKHCKKTVAVCGRCADSGHSKEHCLNAVKCIYTKGGDNHYTGSNACREHQFQKEIIKIETDELIERRTAVGKARLVYSNRTYSAAVRQFQITNQYPGASQLPGNSSPNPCCFTSNRKFTIKE